MKINFNTQFFNKKTVTFTILLILTSSKSSSFFYDDFFERNLFSTMKTLKKNMRDFEQSIQLNCNQLQNILNTTINDASAHVINQQNSNDDAHQFYHQATSSLSFANKEKSIRMNTEKDNDTCIYTISVTDKKNNKTDDDDDDEIQDDKKIIKDLEHLESYIKKSFNNQQALTILQTCIETVKKQENLKNISWQLSHDNNHKTYIIEIDQKKQSHSTPDNDEFDYPEEKEEEFNKFSDRKKRKTR